MTIRMGELLEVGSEELKKLFPEKTERLKLLPRTRLHSDAEAAGSAELAEILAARVPEGWPPKFVAPPASEAGSWSNCYLIHTGSEEEPILIGMAGAARWPAEKRTL